RNPRSGLNEWCSGRAGSPSGQGARVGFGHWNVDGARPISRENAAENAAGEEYPRRSETCVIEWELSRRRLTSTRALVLHAAGLMPICARKARSRLRSLIRSSSAQSPLLSLRLGRSR